MPAGLAQDEVAVEQHRFCVTLHMRPASHEGVELLHAQPCEPFGQAEGAPPLAPPVVPAPAAAPPVPVPLEPPVPALPPVPVGGTLQLVAEQQMFTVVSQVRSVAQRSVAVLRHEQPCVPSGQLAIKVCPPVAFTPPVAVRPPVARPPVAATFTEPALPAMPPPPPRVETLPPTASRSVVRITSATSQIRE